MDRVQLYTRLADRKSKPKDLLPYTGDNGRVNKCVDLVKQGKLCRGGTLLDVGGGIGDLGAALHDLFQVRYTIDISKKNLQAAATKGNIAVEVDLDNHGLKDFPDGSVDLLTALDFIEHIIDPENFAREAFRVLKGGGHAFINTPNIQFWRHILTLVGGKMPHTSGDREVYHGGHLAFFTYEDLQEIFGNAGFNGMEQFPDEDGYEVPPPFINTLAGLPKNQAEFKQMHMRFGNPNMLFKAVKS